MCKLYKYYLRKRRTRLLKGKVDIHPSAILLDSAYFDYRTEEESKRIFIDEESMIGCNFIFESDSGVIKIGKRTFINAGTNIISINEIEIGDDVTIGWNIYIYDHDSHSLDYRFRKDDIEIQREDFYANRNFIFSKAATSENRKHSSAGPSGLLKFATKSG